MPHESTTSVLTVGETEVARIGLGTNRLTNTPEHIAFVKEAAAAGLTHIDTAHSYTGGESEETIGAALSPFANSVVATTGSARSVEQIEQAREIVPIAAVQNHYNLSERRWEEVVDYCARAGIVFVPFFPLRGDGGRPLMEIAKRHRATPAQITLAWLLRRSPAMLPIPGTLSLDHVRQNLAALEIELSDAEFETLSKGGSR